MNLDPLSKTEAVRPDALLSGLVLILWPLASANRDNARTAEPARRNAEIAARAEQHQWVMAR